MSGNPRPQLLAVTHRVPFPPDRGDRIRTWHVLSRLAQHFDVHLAALADEPVHMDTWRAVRSITRRLEVQSVPGVGRWPAAAVRFAAGRSITESLLYSPALHQTIRRWAAGTRFDAALAVCSSMAMYLDGVDARRKVVDLIDVDSVKWASFAEQSRGLRRIVYRCEAGRIAACEKRIGERFDAVAVVTEAEATLARRHMPGTRILVARNGVDTDYFSPDEAVRRPEGPPAAVFVGALNYRPNVQGIDRFARDIWPGIRRVLSRDPRPAPVLRIIGRSPVRAVRRLNGIEGVEVVGPVTDVRPYLRSARLAIAPMTVAPGVQNKVLEAMASALPVVCTSQAAAGIDAVPDRHLLVADDDGMWVRHVTALLRDAERAESLGRAARRFVTDHHRWGRGMQPLIDLLLGQSSLARQIHPQRIAA